jgi:hypothetical protein
MSELMRIVESLQDTDATVKHLAAEIAERPDDDVLRINAEAVSKRQRDLVRRLDYTLHAKQAELVQYRIKRDWAGTYPAKAVAATVTAFQELVTAVFDSIRSGPKLRYRPSADSVDLSTFDFAGASPGSVIVSLAIPNDRLLLGETDLDVAFGLVERTLSAREGDDLKLLADKVGVAAIAKAYQWAEASVAYGLDTQIQWGKSLSDLKEVAISLQDAAIVKDLIENKSESEDTPETLDGILVGFDGATLYFHFQTFDDARDIRGSVSPSLPKSWTTNKPYRAYLTKTVQVRYATGEEQITWTLTNLEQLPDAPAITDQTA